MSRFRERREAVGPLIRSARSLSFSQYGEDLLLAVTLFPNRHGRFVDVGAYHPWKSSNTYKLYLRGWSGLTIEPNPDVAELFRRKRPRDTHVVGGVGASDSTLTYHRFDDAKLNTFSDEQVRTYRALGFEVLDTLDAPCRPLQSHLDAHGVGAIDLLAIDCEGYDLIALQGLDFARSRPTAILVEDYDGFAKLKNGSGRSDIEDLLRSRGYAPVGQALYTSLYVHLDALKSGRDDAFRLTQVQFA